MLIVLLSGHSPVSDFFWICDLYCHKDKSVSEPIPPPAHSGNNVVLPYYPGCLYVAYQAEDGKSVSFQINL